MTKNNKVRYMSLAEAERFNLSRYFSVNGFSEANSLIIQKHCYRVNSGGKYYFVSEDIYSKAHVYPLWNSKYTPDEITGEMIQEMDIPESLRFLRWLGHFLSYEEAYTEKSFKEPTDEDLGDGPEDVCWINVCDEDLGDEGEEFCREQIGCDGECLRCDNFDKCW